MNNFDKNIISKYYPECENLMVDPMLIHQSTEEQLKKADESGEWFVQEKKDGGLYLYTKTPNYSYLFSRTKSKKQEGLPSNKIDNVLHIKDALNCLPANTVILGEIYYPGKTSKDMTSIMGCLASKANERQKKDYGLIHYYIYDILYYNNENYIDKLNNWERYNKIKEIFNEFNLSQYNFLELAESWEDNLCERAQQFISLGGEGGVCKLKTGMYQEGKRPTSNLKMKQKDYTDVIITGFEPPELDYRGTEESTWPYWYDRHSMEFFQEPQYNNRGYHETTDEDIQPCTKAAWMGWNNSKIKVSMYDENNKLIDFGVISSGITDEMKADMTKNPNNYLNHVCSIQCMSIDKNEHTFRHAYFKSLREDKNPNECKIDTLSDNITI